MEQSILAQCAKAKQTPATVERLILDHCVASRLQELAQCKNLLSLSIINAGLQSLDGFPSLLRLRTLELSDNRIVANGLEALANAGLAGLTKLNLSGNRLAAIENLRPLATIKSLRNLDLFNCPVTKHPQYRAEVWKMLPALELLDGTNSAGQEVEDDEDDDEDEGDSEDEEDEEEGNAATSQPPKKRKAGDTSEEDEEEEDEDEDEEEGGETDDEAPRPEVKKAASARIVNRPAAAAPAEPAEDESSEEESSSDAPAAQVPAAGGGEDESESEEEMRIAKRRRETQVQPQEHEQESSSSDEEER